MESRFQYRVAVIFGARKFQVLMVTESGKVLPRTEIESTDATGAACLAGQLVMEENGELDPIVEAHVQPLLGYAGLRG